MLLDTVEAYCHPEAYDEAYDDLISRAQDPDGDDAIKPFKEQLRIALMDPTALAEDALFEAAQYSEGSDTAFLRKLWSDLYPDEPAPDQT